jgi:hypothetical protein
MNEHEHDDELEGRLRAYRPADPPTALRQRVTAAAGRPRPLSAGREWLPAAAAALIAMLFYWLAASDRQRLLVQFSPVDSNDAIESNLEAR